MLVDSKLGAQSGAAHATYSVARNRSSIGKAVSTIRKLKGAKVFEFPLVKGEQNVFPDDFVCPICRKARIGEPHTFVSLDGGALLMDREEDSGGPSDDMDGFLQVYWHGAHDQGDGGFRETGGFVPIVDHAVSGQFGIIVCSSACLRKMFDLWIDELESRMCNAEPIDS